MSSILLTNSALVYEPKYGGRGRDAGSQSMSTAVHRSPNKLWRSNSKFNLCINDQEDISYSTLREGDICIFLSILMRPRIRNSLQSGGPLRLHMLKIYYIRICNNLGIRNEVKKCAGSVYLLLKAQILTQFSLVFWVGDIYCTDSNPLLTI